MSITKHAQPRRHHYIPVFYLRRWAGNDGRLCQFSKEAGIIRPLRRSSKATGFIRALYELRDFPPDLAQQIESKFFHPIDSLAADALDLLEKDGDQALWNPDIRSAWTRFNLSLLLRCPEYINTLRMWWPNEFRRTDPAQEARYQSQRSESDPPTFFDFLSTRPEAEIEKYQFEFLFKLIDSSRMGTQINNLHWRVVDFTPDCVPLLTSDRPVIRTSGLMLPNGHLALPIGPRKLFVATHDDAVLNKIKQVSRTHLAKEINQHVVRNAVRYVYAIDDKHLPFIKKNFGTVREARLMEEIVNAPQSPSPAIGLVPREPPI
ncbi:DUF4238 domain-containing protein [Xanthobacter sp. KR7-225]|uniref:DUF4238 domain-containing protein n=1 Tax=Xanthobacter sp. KR7-225 TaxID=3156613 RepID=UPI0032B5E075